MNLRAIAQLSTAALLLAALIHLDWHVARPAHHHLSLGWTYHWLFAVPVFAFLARYIHHRWPESAFQTSAAVIGAAAFLAGVVEPAGELLSGAPLSWTFGAERLVVFGVYLGTGIAAHTFTLLLLRKRGRTSRPAVV